MSLVSEVDEAEKDGGDLCDRIVHKVEANGTGQKAMEKR